MKNKLFPIFIILIFTIIFVIFYKGLQNTNVYTPETKMNNKIPRFSTELFYSKKLINSSELFSSDKFYLVNIWSSWCVPCREEHRFLMRLKENRNIEIVGLNYKDKQKNAKKFLDELRNPYKQILLDEDGTISIEWGAYGVPESFLIHNKKIIKKIIGPLNENSVSEIERLLK